MPRAPSSNVERIVPLAIAAIVVLAFVPAMQNGFVSLDDRTNFIENQSYRGLDGSHVRWMWTTTLMGHYIPLSWMTLGLDYVAWGMNPAGYHLTNVVLHALSAVLLFFLAHRLLAMSSAAEGASDVQLTFAAAAAALLWAIHPLRVESVAWITERRDVLSCLFLFASTLAYVVAVGRTGVNRMRWYVAAVGLFVAAILSKATSMTLPAVLLLLNVYPLRRLGGSAGWRSVAARRVYLELVPFVIVAAAAALVSILVLHPPEQLTLPAKLAVSAYGLSFYLWKTIVPFSLSPMYELPQRIDPLAMRFVVSYVVVVAAAAGMWLARRKSPGLVTCFAVFGVMTLPMLGIVQNGPQIAADRYTYFGGAAIAVALGGVLLRVRRSRLVPAFSAAVLCGLALLTWNQTSTWRDSETLWRHALRVNENSAFAHVGLAMVANAQGDFEGAVRHYGRAVEINPRYDEGFNNLGNALLRVGRIDDAVRQYEHALSLNPTFAEAHNGLGSVLAQRGKVWEAIEHYQRALAAKPDYAAAQNNWGVALARSGDMQGAIEHYERAIALDSTYADAYMNWGNALVRLGKPELAEARYAAALRYRPQDADAYRNLGVAFAQQGKVVEAAGEFRRALEFRPDDQELKVYLARALSAARDSAK